MGKEDGIARRENDDHVVVNRASSSGGNLPEDVLDYLITCPDDDEEENNCNCNGNDAAKLDNSDSKDEQVVNVVKKEGLSKEHASAQIGSPKDGVTPTKEMDCPDDKQTNKKKDVILCSITNSNPQPIQMPCLTSLTRQHDDIAIGVGQITPGAFHVTPIYNDPTTNHENNDDSSSSKESNTGSDDMEDFLVSAPLMNHEVAVVARLVEESDDDEQREAALKEIDRLKRELQELKEQQGRPQGNTEVIVAEPLQCTATADGNGDQVFLNTGSSYPLMKSPAGEVHVGGQRESAMNNSKDSNNAKQSFSSKTQSSKKKQLPFDSTEQPMFGREGELKMLQNAFQNYMISSSSTSSSRHVVLVGGESGTGKSVLARELEVYLEQQSQQQGGNEIEDNFPLQQGIYVSGKCDIDLHREVPCAVVTDACEMLCKTLLRRMFNSVNNNNDNGNESKCHNLAARIRQSLNEEEIELLLAFVPSLSKIVGCEESDDEPIARSGGIKYMEIKHRFQHAFKQFINAICSTNPLIVLLDDSHAIDQGSLDLIECLLNNDDGSVEHFPLIVMTFRDNELDDEHRFQQAMNSIKEKQERESNLNLTNIHLEGLTKESVSSLLRHLLTDNFEDDDIGMLAECIHNKTAGNPFYIKQFLLSLQDEELLTFDANAQAWSYDVNQIKMAVNATDNVVTLLTEKIQKLSPFIQELLPRLACLGTQFTTASACVALADCISSGIDKDETVSQVLLTCLQQGLLIDSCEETSWLWSHDKVRETALMLFGDGEKLDQLKFEIGKALIGGLPKHSLESNHGIFTVASLLNLKAGELLEDDPIRLATANLNLQAGRISMRSSSFQAAVQYLSHGIAQLPTQANAKWESQFELSLPLYSLAAEAYYCDGGHNKVKELCDEIIELEKCPLIQKRRVYNALMLSLAAQGKMADAQDLIVKVLSKLGCKFARMGRGLMAMTGIMKVAMTVDKTTSRLADLREMEDEEKKWVIYLLIHLCSFAYQCDPSILPLALLKGLDWTVKYGKTSMTSPLLATIALILAGSVGDFVGAKKFADLALKYMTSSDTSRTLFLCFQFVMHYQIPTHACIKQLSKSHEAGIISGDLDSSFWSAYCVLEGQLYTGSNLQVLIEDCGVFSRQTKSYNQEMIGWSVSPVWQLAINLTSTDSNRHILTGEAMDEEEFKKRTEPYAHYGVQLNRIKTTAAFLFNEHELVVHLMEENGYHNFSIEKATPGTNGIGTLYFHCAMSCLALVHQDKKTYRKQKQQAKKFLKRLRDWAHKGDPNVQHYESMLEAELASCSTSKPFIVAAKHYDCAIMLAGRLGLANDYGLAQECFGDHCKRHGDKEGARNHYSLARDSYEKWGAVARIQMLQRKMS